MFPSLKYSQKKVLCVMIIIFVKIQFNTGLYTETNWQTAVEVNDYKSYSSASTLYFTVPVLSVTSTWQFNAYRTPNTDQCEIRTVAMFLQPGSFPVISPLNETFPPDFNTLRTDLRNFQLMSDNQTYIFTINSPVPGGWYVMAYLGDYVDESIKQKGIGTDCKYYMGSIHVIEALETLEEIPVDNVLQVTANYESSKAYRFHTTEQTWQYQVIVEECSVNQSTYLSPCPIRLSTRALALPLFDSTSNVIDCSSFNSSQCVMTVTAPATKNWHYMIFESVNDEAVEFNLTVYFMTCSNSNRKTKTRKTFVVLPEINGTSNISNHNNSNYLRIGSAVNKTNVISNDDVINEYHLPHSYTANKRVIDSLSVEKDRQIDVVYSRTESYNNNETIDSCNRLSELGRFESSTKIFDVEFKLRYNLIFPITGSLDVSEDKPLILNFEILPSIDIGGTLKYAFRLETKYLNDSSQVVKIHSCIQRLGIPMSEDGVTCHEANYLQVNNTDQIQRELYFPYPEPGHWYITMMAQCFNASDLTTPVKCRQIAVAAVMLAELKQCVNSGCGEYGSCYTYYSAHHRYSSCKCTAGYRGYGCSDGTVAEPDSIQLASTLLLTLSNLLFLPAIIVAAYRRFYPEALSYSYTMFFSAFYHACDGDSKYLYCIMPYNVLSYCDFFGAIMSVWVTCVAMSRLGEKYRSFLFLLAGLVLAMGVTWDRYSFWAFAIPALGGLLIMTAAWTRMCYTRKECYPSKKRWLLFLLPGLLIAGVGLIVYAFFETESNYWYTHSCWHACMALCIVFILPPRKATGKVKFTSVLEDDIPVTLVTSNTTKPVTQRSVGRDRQLTTNLDLENGHFDPV